MTRESDILYQKGPFWVCKARKGYEVYENGLTHATRRAIIGSDGPQWFARAKAEADRRAEKAGLMPADPILDEPFFAMALAAFIAEARAVQGWPDPEKTRQRAYRLYEEELARKNAGAARRAVESSAVDGNATILHNSR